MKGWLIAGVLVAIGGYIAFLEIRASNRAEAFCRSAVVGTSLARLADAAKFAGEKALRKITPDEVRVGFTGIPLFSRHFCIVVAEKGSIKSARVQRLD